MIKPKYVQANHIFTRQEAVEALGISQASFSKYYADYAFDKKPKVQAKYSGYLLNAITIQLTDRIFTCIQKGIKKAKVKPDIPKQVSTINKYDSSDDFSVITGYRDESYYGLNTHRIILIKSHKNNGTNARYILPLLHIWIRKHPDIIVVGTDNIKSLIAQQITRDAILNGYWVQDDSVLLDRNYSMIDYIKTTKRANMHTVNFADEKPKLSFMPLLFAKSDFVNWGQQYLSPTFLANKLEFQMEMNDSLLNLRPRQLNVIINDLQTNILDDPTMIDYLKWFNERYADKNIRLTIITDKKLPQKIEHQSYITGIDKLPIDPNLQMVLNE